MGFQNRITSGAIIVVKPIIYSGEAFKLNIWLTRNSAPLLPLWRAFGPLAPTLPLLPLWSHTLAPLAHTLPLLPPVHTFFCLNRAPGKCKIPLRKMKKMNGAPVAPEHSREKQDFVSLG
jgi:hypothetical protein